MTEELVEKVARGLHLSSGLVRDDMKTRLSLPYREMARAALASIQEDYAIVPPRIIAELCDELEAEVLERYGTDERLAHKRERDLLTVKEARAMISAAERTSQ